MRIPVLVVALGAVGCSTLANLRQRHPAAPPPTAAPKETRPIPYPVVETHAFANAVASGTRTRAGEPGPNYWQQFARYRIDAELVPATSQHQRARDGAVLSIGRPTRSAPSVSFSIRISSRRRRRGSRTTPVTGGTEILRVAVGGTSAREGGHRRRRTRFDGT